VIIEVVLGVVVAVVVVVVVCERNTSRGERQGGMLPQYVPHAWQSMTGQKGK
jgi:hypothetical protein